MKFRVIIRHMALALGIVSTSLGAGAADVPTYPQKPITLLVGFPPGGLTDIMARRFAKFLQTEINATVIVENKPGASGQIATAQVAKAEPDGYTLLVAATHHVINQAINSKLPYDTAKDFSPIAELVSTPNVLVTNPSSPVSNVQEFLTYAKQQPGGLAFGSTSVGGSTHMSGELLTLLTKAPLYHVPYKGASPMMNDVLGGQVPAAFIDLQATTQFIKAGKVKALGVTSTARNPALPNVPTFAEQGVPGFEVSTFIGVYGPANLPKALVERLNKLAVASSSTPESLEFFAANGGTPGTKSATDFAAYVNAEIVKWQRVAKERNIKLQ